MDLFQILKMIGGLSLFLYGMDVMGNGLVNLSGGKLEKILAKITRNKLMAVLLGALVTAIIQSSSATTVMVVGFVNSGLMNLSQAVGVIMGANIGTTFTSWLLSLTGLNGSTFLIKLLKPTSFSPVLAMVGILLANYKTNDKRKNIGTILIGFAILMFGMDTMSASVAPLAENETFMSILTIFSNPIIGMATGALLTAVIQSSSASIGILQALCITGSITYSNAIPIIMGQNIGTCITALISSVGANTNAKRASLIHLYFNLIGTLAFMFIFYASNIFLRYSFLNDVMAPSDIAVIHTLFNVVSTLLLFPFADKLVYLAKKSIKNKENKNKNCPKELLTLDERFLEIPEYALNIGKEAINEMARVSFECIKDSINLMDGYYANGVKDIHDKETLVDEFEDKIGTYLIKLSSKELSNYHSNYLNILLHNLNDFERISDHAVNIAQSFDELYKSNLEFSKYSKDDLKVMNQAILDILQKTFKVFTTLDIEEAKKVEVLEEVIDNLKVEIKQRHIKRLTNNESNFEQGLILEDLITDLERVSDHCSNIAISVIGLNDNSFDVHHYVEENIKVNKYRFMEEYNKVKGDYALVEM